MKTTRHLSRLALAPTFIGVACLASPALAQPVFQCERLNFPVDTTGSRPMAINRSGVVVGAFGQGFIGDYRPGKWDKTGQAQPMAYHVDAIGFHLRGINDDGYATGYNTSWNGPSHGQPATGYIWSPDGTASRLTQYENQRTFGNSINNAGVVAGLTFSTGSPYKATLWKDGAQKYLPPLQAGEDAEAHQINDKDVVVGWSDLTIDGKHAKHAVKWVNRKVKDLGTLPGDSFSEARALNTDGVIVGYSWGWDVAKQPVAWVNGVIQPLTADQSEGEALGVNRRGEIVGRTTQMGATYWPQAGAAPVALDSVIAADHPCRSVEGTVIPLYEATAINARGVIVGWGVASHYLAGFRLVPVPAQ